MASWLLLDPTGSTVLATRRDTRTATRLVRANNWVAYRAPWVIYRDPTGQTDRLFRAYMAKHRR